MSERRWLYFRVAVELERNSGPWDESSELARPIMRELENAEPEFVETAESDYTVTEWAVERDLDEQLRYDAARQAGSEP